ncbi:MAG: DNA mismatch repair protein MutS [Oscillospiraceae bacterium]|jgi:DNA mismatch repair protein MutS|nr:DNA mismatch repair protein MutS [Oscillospiraceae bacterium]
MSNNMTPMKIQYNELKSNYPDCLLFFRLGDFYEMFNDDARLASKELDITLTTRDRNIENPDERTPMCGVPYHSCEAYIARLIAKGYKVAICEQTEDPAQAKGLVRRDVVRVITPGTVTESSMLEEGKSNYVCAVFLEGSSGAVAFCDVSTGEFCVSGFEENAPSHLQNELSRFLPREAVLSKGAQDCGSLRDFIGTALGCLTQDGSGRFDPNSARERVAAQFGAESALPPDGTEILAAGALLGYIEETQKTNLSHINTLDLFSAGRYMELDITTRRGLELTENGRTGEKRGSLLWVLDRTKTPMGGRLLRAWIERPLLSPVAISRRACAVQELFSDNVTRPELMQILSGVGDVARLAGRAVYGTANARDLLSLGRYCAALPKLAQLLEGKQSARLRAIAETDPLTALTNLTQRAICDDPPFSVRDGGLLRAGFSEEADYLRDLCENGAAKVAALEEREKARSGIKKLKVGYNKVFGYYIDVPRAAGDSVPEDYIRKQTLVSNERFFTQELKELESDLLGARERLNALEFRLFDEVRARAASEITRIQALAEAIAELDVYCSLADVAVRNGYTRPEVDLSGTIDIKAGRHPVVERAQTESLFVPNDTFLNSAQDRVAIITGPNMAGKSTYMRQTALIVLMAQMGSFVPCKSAVIGVVDRVFTRIGASDDLAGGRSTFMVEMTEVADILRNATKSSLLILDELGRGTSTFDGMAIARAVLEYCADRRRLGAKTLFATHYHELSALEGSLEGVRNYNISAKKSGGSLVFLRKIVPGAASGSYGIEVAKLAGVPDSILTRARAALKDLESAPKDSSPAAAQEPDFGQMSLTDAREGEIVRRLNALSLDVTTPLEALGILYELKKKVEL